MIRVCFLVDPKSNTNKKKHKKVCSKTEASHPPPSKKSNIIPPYESSFPTNQTYRPCFLRKRLQALQLGGPAALVGALVASLAAGINGELAAVAARLKTIWDPSQ